MQPDEQHNPELAGRRLFEYALPIYTPGGRALIHKHIVVGEVVLDDGVVTVSLTGKAAFKNTSYIVMPMSIDSTTPVTFEPLTGTSFKLKSVGSANDKIRFLGIGE